jgi:ABC-2 type transport system permease protein
MSALAHALAIAWKEIQIVVRDRGSLAILFLLPVMLSAFLSNMNIMANQEEAEEAIQIEILLVNQDTGVFGEQLEGAILQIPQLAVEFLASATEAEDRVSKGEAVAAVVIPPEFSRKVDGYIPTAIEIIIDPAQPEGASIVTGIMNQAVGEVTIWGEIQYGVRTIVDESGQLARASTPEQEAVAAQTLGAIMTRLGEMRRNPAIAVVSESLEGVEDKGWLESFFAYVFPGFTVMFIFFIVGIVGESLLHEREVGTMRRLLAAPIPPRSVIGGKILAYMLVACAQVVVMFAVGAVLVNMPLGESPLGLVVVSLSVAFVATAMGAALAALVRSAKQADNLGPVLGIVLAGIGGALPLSVAPVSRTEGAMAVLAKFTPHGHAVEAYYSLMADNASLADVLPEVGILLGMGAVFFAFAVWRFRFN